MRRNYVLIAIFSISFVCLSSISLAGIYSGGSGLVGDPYQISSSADINELMNTSGDWGAYFIVTQNIDCLDASWSSGNPKPIGNETTQFTGNFNGNGYKISNITYIPTSDIYYGFFGYTNSGANIKNLGLEYIVIQYNPYASYFGIFCGYNRGTITNCSSSGEVYGFSYIGGLCGYNSATINNCSSNGKVLGNYFVGGLCGDNNSGTITNSYCDSEVSGNNSVGGFCGLAENSSISNCYCIGDVSGSDNVGGFIGYFSFGLLDKCYSTGKVSGTTNMGGFCGFHNGSGTYSCCYWNITTSEMIDGVGSMNPDPSGVTGLTNQQFFQPSNFSCFDFGNVWIMPSSIRYGDRFGNYPILRSILFTFFIPTLTEWAIILFIGLLAGVGGWFLWRRII